MRPILAIIVVSQFLCTSLWFAVNSVIPDLAKDLYLDSDFLAHLTSSIQFGFITGTLFFAVFTISDRFSPSLVFFISSLLAGLFNLGICIPDIHSTEILLLRFLTGYFLAGIYPVGLKIASDYYQEKLGRSLGFLVGALVIGTAFPHLLRGVTIGLPWRYILYSTSLLSGLGGLAMILLVPDGPYRRLNKEFNFMTFMKGFNYPNFRSVSFGYFGHMWELYTFWAFVPVMLTTYHSLYPKVNLNVPILSFLIIASGGPACVFSGIISQHFGAKKIATISLFLSCLCCIVSPLFLFSGSPFLLISFLFIWGFVVIADSPLFSTLISQNAPAESRGASLTIVNCIGFSITILSIQFINALSVEINPRYIYMFLGLGPLLGLMALLRKNNISLRKREPKL